MNEEEKYYGKFNFYGPLALEGYEDDMLLHNVDDKEKENVINNYFKTRDYNYNELKKLSLTDKIIAYKKEYDKLNKIFDYLGREHFIFYDNGNVEYNDNL